MDHPAQRILGQAGSVLDVLAHPPLLKNRRVRCERVE